jgi:hypothetical protein
MLNPIYPEMKNALMENYLGESGQINRISKFLDVVLDYLRKQFEILKDISIIIDYYRKVKMPNYQNGRIYKIVCDKTGEEYLSSTTLTLCQRIAQHRCQFKRFMNGTNPHYCTSYKVLENNDYDIILIEKYPCNSKEELKARERYWHHQENE